MNYSKRRKDEENMYENSEKNNLNKLLNMLFSICIICIIIGVICCIYLASKSKSISSMSNEEIYEKLSLNCNEKLLSSNIDYSTVLQEYIDKIYGYIKDKNYEYLYLNLEKIYTDKVDISADKMVSKLEEISKNGIDLKSYQKSDVDDKECYVCKIGADNSLITIYEYKPGVYSFAFDGFIK